MCGNRYPLLIITRITPPETPTPQRVVASDALMKLTSCTLSGAMSCRNGMPPALILFVYTTTGAGPRAGQPPAGAVESAARQHIEHLYFERFGKERPDRVFSIEEKIRLNEANKIRQRAARPGGCRF